jgi:hypothetical protein
MTMVPHLLSANIPVPDEDDGGQLAVADSLLTVLQCLQAPPEQTTTAIWC